MAIKKAKVTLEGKTALLMHRYPLEPIEAIEKKEPAEQAEIAAYRDPDTDELYIPGIAIQRALINGATYSKGKGRASLQKPAAACLMITPERVSLGTKIFSIDSRAVVVPATKGRVVRHRPRLDAWKVTFELEWEDSLLTKDQVHKILNDTCERVGFLDFRPEKKGPFGRALVVGFKV